MTLAGLLLTVVGSLFFSTKAVLVKLAFRDTPVDAVSLLAARMFFALPFYLLAAWWSRPKGGIAPLTRNQWIYILGLGLAGYYLSSLFDFMGLQYISAGLERLILFLYPSFSVLINAWAFKEKVPKRQRWALALTYAGILLAYVGELTIDSDKPGFFLGTGLIFLCSITFAIYISGSGRLIPQVGTTRFTAYVMLSSSFGVFMHFLVAGNYSILDQSADFVWYGLALGVVATVIPSFLISAGTRRIGSNNSAIISSIGPVSTIIQAWWLLDEPIFATQIIGTLLVLGGVVLLGWVPAKNRDKKPE
ncbi:MAG: DMT family transporter [Chitinophagaceae bacterium]|nr:DMT family transporter [Chitinophagaceae bacterium]